MNLGDLPQISSISHDNRTLQAGAVFVAVQGETHDGHDFIPDAIERGAVAVVHEGEVADQKPNITYIQVDDSRATLAELAQEFYGYPSQKLKLVGVTGTNGKTTTATLLFNLFRKLGYHSALLSTIENRIDEEVFPATHTTPDPIALASFLKTAVDRGCTHAFMECSSHAIDQKRVWGLNFSGVIFTNLTQDHLDYHKTMEVYAEAKKRIVDTLPKEAFALSNRDDQYGEYMLRDTEAGKHFYSIEKKSDFMDVPETRLIGKFNQYNALAVYATAILLGIPENKIMEEIQTLNPPKGRLEFIKSKEGVLGVVDYAHTPDALENVLKTLREVMQSGARIITVVGCGGDRDKTKRPLMGKIAYELSDHTIFSSDNPRHEDPEAIIKDVVANLPKDDKYAVETDRKLAIEKAAKIAKSSDIVLLAGKGHEDYQIIGEKRLHFSDKEELERAFSL